MDTSKQLEEIAKEADILQSDVFYWIDNLISEFPAIDLPIAEIVNAVHRHVVVNDLSYDELESIFDKRFEEEAKNNE